jgi:uncharacterized protein (DUF1800 family)
LITKKSRSTPDPDWAKPILIAQKKLRKRGSKRKSVVKAARNPACADRQHMIELRGWWLDRMAKGPRPLQEKMVLFWHGIWTSVEKSVKHLMSE